MSATNAWNESSPAGTDLISAGDNAIRQFKLDVRERLALDHIWNSSQDDDGKHKSVTLIPDADVTPFTTETPNSLTGATAGGLFDLAQTWNTTGVCTALKVNITDTASSATSLLADLQVGSASMFKVSKIGSIQGKGVLVMGSGDVQLTDTTGKIQALSSTYFADLSGANLTTLNASNLSSGTVPLARLSGITNTEIAAAAAIAYSKLALTDSVVNADIASTAAIAWSKISKTGSSLADLTTRSAGDLSSGTLLDARLSSNVLLKTLPLYAKFGNTTLAAGNTNNLNISDASFFQVNVSGVASVLTGVAGGAAGRVLILEAFVTGGGSFSIENNSASSTAGNRFAFGSGASSMDFENATAAIFVHDGSGWRHVSNTDRITIT